PEPFPEAESMPRLAPTPVPHAPRPAIRLDERGGRAHLVGAGGAGMRSLACWLRDRDWTVSGSDASAGPELDDLRARGAAIHQGHRAEHVPARLDALIASDAISADNPETLRARALGAPRFSYADALAHAVRARRGLAIAGTHGKSTTAAML